MTATGVNSINDVHHGGDQLQYLSPSSHGRLNASFSKIHTAACWIYLADQNACRGSDAMLLEDEQICQAAQRTPAHHRIPKCTSILILLIFCHSTRSFNCVSTLQTAPPTIPLPNKPSTHSYCSLG